MRRSASGRVTCFRPALLLVAALSVYGCARDRSALGCYVCAATATVVDAVTRTGCIGAEECSRYLRAGYLCQDPQSGAMPPFDPTAPPAPTGVRAVAGFAQAQVSWTASAGATSYSVYHSTSSALSPSAYAGVTRTPPGSGLTSVRVGPLAIGTTYYFVVTADDATLSSPPSSPPATATPTAASTWTWVAGPDASSTSAGLYGTKGIPADANVPPPRERAMTWSGPDGALWLFGGARRDASGTSHFSDLWRFDGQRWTWVNGADVPNQSGALFAPGAREGGATWADGAGNLWLFGGAGRDGRGALTNLNDLWRYSVDSNTWRWMGGPAAGDASGVYGVLGLAGLGNLPGARDGAVVWVTAPGATATATVWLFGGTGLDAAGTRGDLDDLWKFDGTWWTWMAGSKLVNQPRSSGTPGIPAAGNTPGARSDAVAWTDASGTLWLFGGRSKDAAGASISFGDVWRLDPSHAPAAWAWVGGPGAPDQPGSYGTKGVAGAGSWPGARAGAVAWALPGGGVWLFGGYGFGASSGQGPLNDLWSFDGTAWTWVSGDSGTSQPGQYGSKGQPDPANVPGARQHAVGWPGPDGSLLLFGGGRPDLDDLWRYLP